MQLSQGAITAQINQQVISQAFGGIESSLDLSSSILTAAYTSNDALSALTSQSSSSAASPSAATTTATTATTATAAVDPSGAQFAAAVNSIEGISNSDSTSTVDPLSFGSVDGSAVGDSSTASSATSTVDPLSFGSVDGSAVGDSSSTVATTRAASTATTAAATTGTTAASSTTATTSTDPFEAAGRSTYLQSISTSTGSQTPAQTAQNILGGITGYIFAAYQKAHPNLSAKDLATFQQQVTLGVEEGIGDAESKLAGQNQLSASVSSDIDTVRTTVLSGLTSFISSQNAALLAAATNSTSSNNSTSSTANS